MLQPVDNLKAQKMAAWLFMALSKKKAKMH